MPNTTPLGLLVPILCTLALAGPANGQIPATTRTAAPTNASDSAWRVFAGSTVSQLADAITVIEHSVLENGRVGAWDKMTCHNNKLAELRGLRRAAVDATDKIAGGLADGHTQSVRLAWDRLLATHDHGPLLYQDALTCDTLSRREAGQVVKVFTGLPTWDEDEDLGVPPASLGR